MNTIRMSVLILIRTDAGSWTFFRFLARTYGDTRLEAEPYLIRVLSWIEDLFDFLAAHYVVIPPAKREGFSHTERQAMLELVHPLNEKIRSSCGFVNETG